MVKSMEQISQTAMLISYLKEYLLLEVTLIVQLFLALTVHCVDEPLRFPSLHG